ncbi:hypothetical protein NSMM_310020 [Nitrosomonas mobilis]|uniref:Uncharacterized protein n=1 Tax=Nitrosomonas mobilis TaxID=51642 RepID=A0A1G5SCU6_9PROT|nr:hypothetical protein NSMM_310020 [Nitrosomonas mobilis]
MTINLINCKLPESFNQLNRGEGRINDLNSLCYFAGRHGVYRCRFYIRYQEFQRG